jgi:serine phosphatase RsbU (regulator of sigma subunit)
MSFSSAWGQVRWKMIAIITFTGTSTILAACLAVAALNVVVRRESANVVENQIQVLLQASRSVAPAILNHAGVCREATAEQLTNSGGLKPLLTYTDEVFPEAQISLTVEGATGAQSLLPPKDPALVTHPAWLPKTGYTGLVVDRGQVEIRNVLVQQRGACKVTAIVRLPLGSELAKRLSSSGSMKVTPVTPRLFRVHSPKQQVLETLEANFMPGVSRPISVVLAVRNWETGGLEDWLAYTVRDSYSGTFEGVARIGRQLANWVWLLAALSLAVLLIDASGVWMSIRFGREIATAIDDLSSAARQIGGGNFGWRTPVRSKGQLGDLTANFNEMAIALERLQKEEAARLRLESELKLASSVQDYLFPRLVPVLRGATVSGRTSAARTIGGDLYDFLDLGQERIGIVCADVSGKGIPAALMMANLQAIARAHLDDGSESPDAQGAHFVETLNQRLAGRFGDNRYATLVWAEYDARTAMLTYVNAGHPSPILIRSSGEIERLKSDGVPIGLFADSRYTARNLQMGPGSRLIIFTDGLTDAQNAAGEDFGDERLVDCCRSIPVEMDANGVADTVMQAIAEWSAGTEQFDDTTVVAIDIVAVDVGEAESRHHCQPVVTNKASIPTVT